MNSITCIVINFCFIISAVRAEPHLLYSNRTNILLIDAGSDQLTTSQSVIGQLINIVAIDFAYDEQYLFWGDITRSRISKVYFNGMQSSEEEDVIASGLFSNNGLAVDWIGRKIYWTDKETSRIELSNFDGSYRKVIIWEDVDKPRAIALDPLNGYMYWTDWGEVPKIERAGMDGTKRTVVIEENIHWPNGLTIDYEESRLFWTDAGKKYIHSCNFDGSDRVSVIEGADLLPHPFAITLYRDTIYWTDWKLESISSCNKNDGRDRRVVESDIVSPMDIHVYSEERQNKSSFNRCAVDNGGCSHLCLMSPNELHYSCACPTGVVLLEDQYTCADDLNEFLLLVRRSDIRQISLDTPGYIDTVIEVDDVQNAVAIDYDPINGFMYWTDDVARAIRRAKLDGSKSEYIIKEDILNPDGIAVDWISGNLYWTDTGNDRIEVSRLNGTSRRILIDDNLDEPRAIAVDPEDGYMYWTDWGENPKIERAALDGSDRKVLVNTSLNWPNGIAVDYEQRRIYWGDAKTDRIESVTLDGSNRAVLVDSNLPHLFGLTLLGDFVYFTDWQMRHIERVNKFNGMDRKVIIGSLPDMMGLKAINVKKEYGTNACSSDNGGCSHLCLYTQSGIVCMCPPGLELHADKKTCIPEKALLVVLYQDSGLHLLGLEANASNTGIPIEGTGQASAIDFDFQSDRIYWANKKTKQIMTAFMNGSGHELFIKYGLRFPEDIAVDWTGKNLYWTDSGSNSIEVARLDGSSRRALIWQDIDYPNSLAIDPIAGYMYWSEWSRPYRISKAHMDGTSRNVIIHGEGRATGLTLDYQASRLFWVDLDLGKIYSADLDGNNNILVVQDYIKSPFALAQNNEFIYWADLSVKTIERANKTSGAGREIIQGQQDNVFDIKVFHESRQAGINMCNFNNGGCSDLCLSHPNGFRCKCEAHHTLNVDNSTCSPPEEFLIYSQTDTVNRVLFDFEEPHVVLPINKSKHIAAVEYDIESGFIFWIDRKNREIKRSRSNGGESETIVSRDGISPYDMVYDPYNRLIFWCCKTCNKIHAIHTNGTAVGAIVEGPGQKPRGVALMPLKGLIFWVNNQKKNPSLEQATVDGLTHVDLVNTGLYRPGPITADEESNRIYWFDSRIAAIEYVHVDSGARYRVPIGHVGNVVSLTVYGDFIYTIDAELKAVERTDKNTGANHQTMLRSSEHLTDILAVKEPDSTQPCSRKNGLCSHFCIPTGIGTSRCSCPKHLKLDEDGKMCIVNPTCAPDQFTCVSGDIVCIPAQWGCDGQADCSDASDEMACEI